MKRKIIISALALILLACLLPGAMLAADNGDGSGAGEANAWDISAAGDGSVLAYYEGDTITITGDGAMKNYDRAYRGANDGSGVSRKVWAPWIDRSTGAPFQEFKHVVIKPGVTTIGTYAFSGMYDIESVVIPEGVTSIGSNAFINCKALKQVDLPASFATIGEYRNVKIHARDPFEECDSLEKITIADGNTAFKLDDQGIALLGADGTKLIAYPAAYPIDSYTIPDGVTELDYGAFSSAKVQHVTAPESLKKIGDWCFSYTKIHSLTLPNKVTLVAGGAFNNSPDLQEVKLGTADSFWYDESVLNRIANLKVVDATAYNGAIAFGTNGVNMPGRNLLIYTQQQPTTGVGKAAVAVAENGTIDSEQAIAAAPDFVLPVFSDKIATGWLDASDQPATRGAAGNIYHLATKALSGVDGGIRWSFDPESGTLTIAPAYEPEAGAERGVMKDYSDDPTDAPWAEYADDTTSLVIEDGVTHLGDNAFASDKGLTKVTIHSDELKDEPQQPFKGCDKLVEVVFDSAQPPHIPDGLFNTNADGQGTNGHAMIVDLTAYDTPLSDGLSGLSSDSIVLVDKEPADKGETPVIWAVTGPGVAIDTTNGVNLGAISKDGYTVKWYKDAFKEEPLNDETPTAPNTYYAKWTPKSAYDMEEMLRFDALTFGQPGESQDLHPQNNSEVEYQGDFAAVSSDENIVTATVHDGVVTVTPNPALPAGTHHTTVTVTTPDGVSREIPVRLTVAKAQPALVLSEDEGSVYTGDSTSFTYTYSGDGAVSVSSSDESIATASVDPQTKTVTVKALRPGSATLTVLASESDNHLTASATYALTVKRTVSPTPSDNVHVKTDGNGKIHVSDKNAGRDEKVTITVKPDDGYTLDKLTVTDRNGNTLPLTKEGENTYSFIMPQSRPVSINASFVEQSADDSLPFVDVHKGDWFYDVVKDMYERGLMTGTGADTFSPDLSTTRGMIVSILYRLEGSPACDTPETFADVNDGDWYADAVRWAASENIVAGYSAEAFGPNDPITREQLASILYHYTEYKGGDVTARADLSTFADGDSVADWSRETVEWANAEGLVKGQPGNLIDPQGQATRAQVAAIFARYLEN